MQVERYIGIMSGTSMDAIDTVLVEISEQGIKLLEKSSYPFPSDLKEALLPVAVGGSTTLKEVGEFDHELGLLYAKAVKALLKRSKYKAEDIRAIGNHGQTVYHQPTGKYPFTMQLGDGNLLATLTGIDTVADFRRKDMALGGQGAPLVPAFHRFLYPKSDSTQIILNIGGISNISVFHPVNPVIGYDTGPGNILMDAWGHHAFGVKFDNDAVLARQGKVDTDLLNHLLKDPYLKIKGPKSTGREHFNLDWLAQYLSKERYIEQDILRTLCEYTALTICNEIRHHRAGSAPQVWVCGGGARNPLLMERIRELLPDWNVDESSQSGASCDAMEAMAFAWFAYCRIHNIPSNVPEVTGASREACLGVLYFA